MSGPRGSVDGIRTGREEERPGAEVDGEIDAWIPVMAVHDGPVVAVVGLIRGDRKGRWEDGTPIITSMIREGQVIAPGAVVRTLNGVYRLLGRLGTREDACGSGASKPVCRSGERS